MEEDDEWTLDKTYTEARDQSFTFRETTPIYFGCIDTDNKFHGIINRLEILLNTGDASYVKTLYDYGMD